MTRALPTSGGDVFLSTASACRDVEIVGAATQVPAMSTLGRALVVLLAAATAGVVLLRRS
jgi:hypothetical protein